MANENMIHKHLDNFLAKIAGETPIDDNPRNSTEFWLNEIAENLPGGGTTVVANPTLAGTEDPLTGLQVGDTKYSVPVIHLYEHNISTGVHTTINNGDISAFNMVFYTNQSTVLSLTDFINFYFGNYSNQLRQATGFYNDNGTIKPISGLHITDGGSLYIATPSGLISISAGSLNYSFNDYVKEII